MEVAKTPRLKKKDTPQIWLQKSPSINFQNKSFNPINFGLLFVSQTIRGENYRASRMKENIEESNWASNMGFGPTKGHSN